MNGKLKALGLALAAMFAFGAISATGASAQATQDLVTLDKGEEAVITGTSHDNRFVAGLAPVSCTTSVFSGTVKDNAESINIDATYSGTINQTEGAHEHCNGPGNTSATIDMNGCGYTVSGLTSGDHDPEVDSHAPVWITCEPEKEITITTSTGCNIHIPAQTPTEGGLTFENTKDPEAWDVKAKITVTGITYSSTHPICTLAGLSPEGNNAEYNGTATITAFEDKEKVTTWEYKEGNQVGITVTEE